jgi:mannosyl-3-phosphoglycerate phosphatase
MPEPPAATKPPLVVFTDLDGTLLDARTYSATPAREALSLLQARGSVVVFCSSKTAAEQRVIRAQLGLMQAPLIVENGSAVIVPEAAGLSVADWPVATNSTDERARTLGRPAIEVRAGVARAAASIDVRVTGYSDLTVRQIAELTGLDLAAAERARSRDYSETLVDEFPPATWVALETALFAEGLYCRHGGRFRTVTGATVDKGCAVRIVSDLYSAKAGRQIVTAGLGDSANDDSLLAAVDRPYLLSKMDGTWEPMEHRGLRRIAQPGPRGWHEAIVDLLGAVW